MEPVDNVDKTVKSMATELLSARVELARLREEAALLQRTNKNYELWMNADKLKIGTSVNVERGVVMIICNPDDADKFVKTEDEHGKIDL